MDYSAIYRALKVRQELTYGALRDRAETTQYIFIYRR